MFNRTAEQESATVHYIQDTMGKSRKKNLRGRMGCMLTEEKPSVTDGSAVGKGQ